MLHDIRCQTNSLLRGWGARLCFLLLTLLVLENFVNNALAFRGYDAISMYHPMRLLTLSYDHANYKADTQLFLIQLIPLLICLPAGLSLAADQSTGMDTLQIARMGQKRYLRSRLISAFLVTALVISGPFLVEIILNCLSFPLRADGSLTNLDMYDPAQSAVIERYDFLPLYQHSPYLYALWKTVLFGVYAGLLAAATTAFSSVVRIRYRVFLLLPVFVLLTASTYFGQSARTKWYSYALIFCDEPRNPAGPILFICAVVFLIALFYVLGSRKDHLK